MELTCGHKAPAKLFRLTPRQAFYGYTMGDNVYDMLVSCPSCGKLSSLVRPS